MIPELGFYLLILALMTSLVQIYAGHRNISKLTEMAASLTFACITLSFCALIWSFAITDLSVLTVTSNSHSMKPWLYKITGTWGNHEGSMLLWVLILSLFGALIALFDKNMPQAFKDKTLMIQAALIFGFLSFIIITSNPFMRLYPAPLDGQGLNPLLQDPGLAFHPPLLYIGYVGFSIVFALGLAALITGEIHKNWATWIRPWVLIAWSGLSAGIALGSWWAYYELGWGGWWFWDPVENIALVPWLTGTALLHCALVMEKRGSMARWTLFLAIVTFVTSMLGTFLVRSGVLTSVHSFATDPARGLFILSLCGIYTLWGFILFALRTPKTAHVDFSPISRDSFLLLNNLFVITLAATILIGTLYPLLAESLNWPAASVGAPYYNAVFLPLSLPAFLLMGLGFLIPWKKADRKHISAAILKLSVPSLVALIGLSLWQKPTSIWEIIGVVCAFWLIFSSIEYLLSAAQYKTARLKTLPMDRWASAVAHFGIGLVILGTLSTFVWTKENTYLLEKGQAANIAGYRFELSEIKEGPKDNYISNQAVLDVYDESGFVTKLTPEKRYYPVSGQTTTEAAIHLSIAGDLYAVLGDISEDTPHTRIIKIQHHPLVGLLWLGFGFIVSGGLLSLANRIQQK